MWYNFDPEIFSYIKTNVIWLTFIFAIMWLRRAIWGLRSAITKDSTPHIHFKWKQNPHDASTMLLTMLVDLPKTTSLSEGHQTTIADSLLLDSISSVSDFEIMNKETMYHCYEGNILEKLELETDEVTAQKQHRKSFLFVLKPQDENIIYKLSELKAIDGNNKLSSANTKQKMKYAKYLLNSNINFKIIANIVYIDRLLTFKTRIMLYKEGICLKIK